jgi:hypothetical protein
VRVRLYGLLVAACRNLGATDEGLHALNLGLKLGGSSVARAELLTQGATLHLGSGDAVAARQAVARALELVEKELDRPSGSSYSARRRRLWLSDLKAYCVTLRSEIAMYEHDYVNGMADALRSLTLTSERSALRVRLAAVSCLAAVLLRFGSLNEVIRALTLVDEAEQALARRRVRRSHLHRVVLRWARALALARLGSVDRAENIMVDVIEHLRQKGHVDRLKHAVDALAWIVGERGGRPARADYLQRKYAA